MQVRILRRALLALPLALSFAVPAVAQVVVKHTKGEVTLAARPQRVAVFDPASLDTLHALGVDAVKGVFNTRMPPGLAQYAGAEYAKVGSLHEPDLEALNKLKPDLIIVGGRSSARYDGVKGLAPTIDMTVDNKDFLASSIANARTLGRIFGKEAQAEALIGKLNASLAAIRPQAAGAGKALFVLTSGARMSAYGPGSRFGILHDGYGFVPAQPNLKVSSHGQAASFEFILQANPDWLFVLDRDAAIGRDGSAARQLLDNALVKQTSAARKNQVVFVNASNWYLVGSGLGALQANVDQAAAALKGAKP